MTLKPALSVQWIGARRVAVGVVAGVLVAVAVHGAGLSAGRAGVVVAEASAERRPRTVAAERGRPMPPPAPALPSVAGWAEPLWAALAAALGQAVAVGVWGLRPRRLGESRRAHRRVTAGAAGGLMWGWAALLVAVTGWDVYAHVIRPMYISMGIRGMPDPAAAFLADPVVATLPVLGVAMAVVSALAPWTGVRFGVRTGWWAGVGLAATAAGTLLLWGLGRTVWPG